MSRENASSADNQQERVPRNSENLKHYLAGFADGDGCFSINVHRSKNMRLGWNIDPLFQVYQHKDNSEILHLFKGVLGCGYVSKKGGNPTCHVYCVDNTKDLVSKVIPFFESYPLIGRKRNDFMLFKLIVTGVSEKKHLKKEGFVDLVKLSFQMNRNGKYRRNSLDTILESLEKSPETKRQT